MILAGEIAERGIERQRDLAFLRQPLQPRELATTCAPRIRRGVFIQARFDLDPFIQIARHSKYAVPSRFGTYLDCSKRDLRVE